MWVRSKNVLYRFIPNVKLEKPQSFGLMRCLTDSGSIKLSGYGRIILLMCSSPPSTGNVVPVIHDAAGEKRKTAALAMSAEGSAHLAHSPAHLHHPFGQGVSESPA